MPDREKLIKAYEDFANGYECFCASDDYEYEMHKAVLALLKDQSEEIEHRRYLCKCLFNRCYTINRGEMCKYCACRDECEKERTVDKDA